MITKEAVNIQHKPKFSFKYFDLGFGKPTGLIKLKDEEIRAVNSTHLNTTGITENLCSPNMSSSRTCQPNNSVLTPFHFDFSWNFPDLYDPVHTFNTF